MVYYAGIDAGSTYVKVAVLNERKELVGFDSAPTGIDGNKAAQDLMWAVCTAIGIRSSEVKATVATGYGRRIIKQADNNVTEIKAHAAGARWVPLRRTVRSEPSLTWADKIAKSLPLTKTERRKILL